MVMLGFKKRESATLASLTDRQLNKRLIDDEKVKRDVAKLMQKEATSLIPAIFAISFCVIGGFWFWYATHSLYLNLKLLFASSVVLILAINAALEFHKGEGKPILKAMLAVAQMGIVLSTTYWAKLLNV